MHFANKAVDPKYEVRAVEVCNQVGFRCSNEQEDPLGVGADTAEKFTAHLLDDSTESIIGLLLLFWILICEHIIGHG